jgi:cell division protein FtsN/nucleoid DNA-binding protein
MSIGKYIRNLLEERKRVILPGFGSLEVISPEGAQAPSGNRLNPPGTTVKFDTGFSKDDGLLAEVMAAGEVLEREEAQQRVLELVDAIRFSLDKGEDYLLPETGTFSKDADGKIYFHTVPAWVLEPDQYGLDTMDLLELEDLPIEEEAAANAGKESKASSRITELAPPKPKPTNKKWRVIWLVAAALIVVLVVLILIPSEETENGERRKLFNRQPEREVVEDLEGSKVQQDVVIEEQNDSTEAGPQDVEAGPQDAEAITQEREAEEEQDLPVEVSNTYFIIAGSFSKLKNASDLQDQLKSQGFNAEVIITENRMYRVSVASYATKEEAEKELSKIKTESGLESCWLLSN